MSDFDSSLPVRTQNDGDVVAKIGDRTTPSQQLAVDANGLIGSRLYDVAGTGITSQVNGVQQALDVGINVAGVQIDPRQIRALTAADVVTAQQGTSPWVTKDQADGPVAPGAVAAFSQLAGGQYNLTPPTLADTEQSALQLDSAGRLLVDAAISSTDDHNYGVVGANTLRTAAQIGNATGAADFNAGATGAQTLRVQANQGAPGTNANGWFVRPTDGTNNQSFTAAGEAKVSVTQPLPAGANNIGSVNQGTSPWITKDQADGSATGGTAGLFSMLSGGIYNTTPPTLTNGQQVGLQLDVNGRLLVDAAITSTDDHNYGTVGANTLRTAAQIGNATGAADFNFGTVGAQTLRTASEIGNATGAASFNYGAVSAQTLRTASQVGNATGAADFNFGTIGAQSLRVASQIGNATGAADFNNGATGAQTLRVAANLAVAGANVTAANPVPVSLVSTSPGTPVNDYKRAIGIAAGATDNHDYTVTAGLTLHLNQIESSGSGKAKMEVEVETGVATGVFTTRFVQFNSTATPNMHIELINPIQVAAGVRVRVVMKNTDLAAQDMYSTISGFEI